MIIRDETKGKSWNGSQREGKFGWKEGTPFEREREREQVGGRRVRINSLSLS